MQAARPSLPRRVVWRRLDVEGMDACAFDPDRSGHILSGAALCVEDAEPARFEYRVSCDSDWASRSARVTGWQGAARREVSLSRDPRGIWTVDGHEIDWATGLLDIDLGFTPATNTNAIKRLGLAIGDEVETTAIWLDAGDWRVKPLRQAYRRLSETEFLYLSPDHDYSARLVVDDFGIVRLYPRLWTAISAP